jgi:acetyl esterase/lipase
VDCEQARRLHARRVELGLPVSLSTYPGAEHAFFSAGGELARRGKADLFSALESGL